MPVQTAPVSSDANAGDARLIEALTRQAGRLGGEVADVTGHVQQVVGRVTQQALQFRRLQETTQTMAAANQRIDEAAKKARAAAESSGAEIARAGAAVRVAVGDIGGLIDAVQRIEERLGAIQGVLQQVAGVSKTIEAIAAQTNLLALNATIEAARAGAAGKGFSVVAGEVKSLSGETRKATQQIADIVQHLTSQVKNLIEEGGRATGSAAKVREGAVSIENGIATIDRSFAVVGSEIGGIAEHTDSNLEHCRSMLAEVEGLAGGVTLSAANLQEAEKRLTGLLGLSDTMVEYAAAAGHRTADSPFIEAAQDAARRIGALFEAALDRGEITTAALFDENYREIPGSNPLQHMTGFVELADRLLPAIQEPLLAFDPRVVFCAAVDRNGYLPTHNRKFSQAQGKDPVWNTAHCRNRRIFNDRTGLAAGRNTKPFLLQTYRRDMGGGNFALMKDVSAPILVRGRHWGGLRIGYRSE